MLTEKGLTLDLANTSEQLFIKLDMARTDFVLVPDIGGLEIIKLFNLKREDFGYTKHVSSVKRSLIFSLKNPNKKIITDFNSGYKTIMKKMVHTKLFLKNIMVKVKYLIMH